MALDRASSACRRRSAAAATVGAPSSVGRHVRGPDAEAEGRRQRGEEHVARVERAGLDRAARGRRTSARWSCVTHFGSPVVPDVEFSRKSSSAASARSAGGSPRGVDRRRRRARSGEPGSPRPRRRGDARAARPRRARSATSAARSSSRCAARRDERARARARASRWRSSRSARARSDPDHDEPRLLAADVGDVDAGPVGQQHGDALAAREPEREQRLRRCGRSAARSRPRHARRRRPRRRAPRRARGRARRLTCEGRTGITPLEASATGPETVPRLLAVDLAGTQDARAGTRAGSAHRESPAPRGRRRARRRAASPPCPVPRARSCAAVELETRRRRCGSRARARSSARRGARRSGAPPAPRRAQREGMVVAAVAARARGCGRGARSSAERRRRAEVEGRARHRAELARREVLGVDGRVAVGRDLEHVVVHRLARRTREIPVGVLREADRRRAIAPRLEADARARAAPRDPVRDAARDVAGVALLAVRADRARRATPLPSGSALRAARGAGRSRAAPPCSWWRPSLAVEPVLRAVERESAPRRCGWRSARRCRRGARGSPRTRRRARSRARRPRRRPSRSGASRRASVAPYAEHAWRGARRASRRMTVSRPHVARARAPGSSRRGSKGRSRQAKRWRPAPMR